MILKMKNTEFCDAETVRLHGYSYISFCLSVFEIHQQIAFFRVLILPVLTARPWALTMEQNRFLKAIIVTGVEKPLMLQLKVTF